MSVLCISHRTKEWDAVMDECRALWKELLHIPDTHEVVFLGGGASLQFLYVAMNFLEKKAAYLDTGVWASKALKEAKGIGDAYAIASSKDKNYTYIPKGFEIQHHLRHRDPRGPRRPVPAHRRHVLRHHVPSGGRFQV